MDEGRGASPTNAQTIGRHTAWFVPPDTVRWCIRGKITGDDARALHEHSKAVPAWRYMLVDASVMPVPDAGARAFWADPKHLQPPSTLTVIYGARPAVRAFV